MESLDVQDVDMGVDLANIRKDPKFITDRDIDTDYLLSY